MHLGRGVVSTIQIHIIADPGLTSFLPQAANGLAFGFVAPSTDLQAGFFNLILRSMPLAQEVLSITTSYTVKYQQHILLNFQVYGEPQTYSLSEISTARAVGLFRHTMVLMDTARPLVTIGLLTNV